MVSAFAKPSKLFIFQSQFSEMQPMNRPMIGQIIPSEIQNNDNIYSLLWHFDVITFYTSAEKEAIKLKTRRQPDIKPVILEISNKQLFN